MASSTLNNGLPHMLLTQEARRESIAERTAASPARRLDSFFTEKLSKTVGSPKPNLGLD